MLQWPQMLHRKRHEFNPLFDGGAIVEELTPEIKNNTNHQQTIVQEQMISK